MNPRKTIARPALLGCAALALAALGGCAPDSAQSPGPEARHSSSPTTGPTEAAEAACTEVSINCGSTPSLTFDDDDRLWAAFELDGHAYLTYSDDSGGTFAAPVQINSEEEVIETNGEGRPKVAIGPEGTVYASWTKKIGGMYNGEIRFTRSLDGGVSFEPVRTVNDDGIETGHRFDTLFVDRDGNVYLAWIDKRDLEAAKSRGEEYRGAGLYYTVSTDRGATFVPNRRVANYACECCRIVAADGPDGGTAILWRHVFEPNIRDHAFAVLGTEGLVSEPVRVSHEGWELDACPHHGPAMVRESSDAYHMAWFTAADKQPRIYYGLFDRSSGETRQVRQVASGAEASHADITMADERLVLVWKNASPDQTSVFGITSIDDGETWSEPWPIAMTTGTSDHPFLLSHDGEAYLAWQTEEQGLRVLPVGSPEATGP